MSDSIQETEEKDIPIEEESVRFRCTSCGGDMVFNPEQGLLVCDYCGNEIDIDNEDAPIKEYDILNAEHLASRDWGDKTKEINCRSCGARTIVKANSISAECAFCGSNHVFENEQQDAISPETIIPFKIAKDKAKELFKKWIGKRYMAPKKLKEYSKIDNIKGIYFPYWTYDSDTDSVYSAQRGDYYYVTKVRTVSDGNGGTKTETYQERHTKWRRVHGTYDMVFDDILIYASKGHKKKIIKKLEPFNLSELVPYKPDYLSGFGAERYSIGVEEGWKEAKQTVDSEIKKRVIRKIGGDEVRNLKIRTSYNDVKFKHFLLPIWIAAYKFNNKVYNFMVNGQTGEVQGEAPVSPVKVAIITILGLAVAAGLYFILRNK